MVEPTSPEGRADDARAVVEAVDRVTGSGPLANVPTQQLVAEIRLTVYVKDPATGEVRWKLGLPAVVWLALYRSCHTVGQETTVHVARLGALLAGHHQVFKHRDADHAQRSAAGTLFEDLTSAETQQAIASNINDLYTTAREMWRDEEEIVLDATYRLLRNGLLDHYSAARAAGALLGKHFSPTAWRLRVSRWATKKGLPPVTLPRGGNRRQTSTVTETDPPD